MKPLQVVVLLLAIVGCTGRISEPGEMEGGEATGGGGGSSTVTFCEVAPIFAARCSGCHGATALTPLVTRAQLTASSPAGGSMIDRAILRMKVTPVSGAMPPNVGGNASDLAALEAWRSGGLLDCQADGGAGGGSSGGGSGGGAEPSFECDPGAPPNPAPLLRLTADQYRATLSSVLSNGLTGTEVRSALSAISSRLNALPAEGEAQGETLVYDTEDQRISRVLVDPQVYGAMELGTWLATDTPRLERFVRANGGTAPCATIGAPECVTAFIQGFGKAALRRPLDPSEVTEFKAFYDDTGYGGYQSLIAGILISPSFVFRTEFRGAPVTGSSDIVALTPWELAARLSYSLTGAPPDLALLTAAEGQFTGTGKTVEEQAARLVASPKARAHQERFYRQWLRPDRVPPLDTTAAAALTISYPDWPGSALPASTDLVAYRDDAFEELVTLMSRTTTGNRSMREALMSQQSYARSDALAAAYGVTKWGAALSDGGVDETPITFPAGQRVGLFSRAGYLLSGYADPSPIKRGARLRVEYLCDLLVPPDCIATPDGGVPPAVPTPRSIAVAKTEIPGTNCSGCHKALINPLGFALEHYDSLGRFRTQQPVQLGSATTWHPVDATSKPNIEGASSAVTHGADELSTLLADSAKFNACFSTHLFRYTLGREGTAGHGTTTLDGCALRAIQTSTQSGTLREAFTSTATLPSFRLRRLSPEN